MNLTEDQTARYESDGFLLLENCFSPDEVKVLCAAMEEDHDQSRGGPHVVHERDDRTLRALYAPHLRHPVFRRLMALDRMLLPARRLTGENDLYVHQLKINAKQPFGGERWSWHQDFIVWRDVDDMPAPRAVNIGLFLDDMHEFNGPVVFLRGSHRIGTLERDEDGARDGTALRHVDPDMYSLRPDELTRMVRRHEMVSPKGAAGSVVLFHPEIVHGSAPNISVLPRRLLIATYNPVDNAPRRRLNPRPEYLVGRPSGTPLTVLRGSVIEG